MKPTATALSCVALGSSTAFAGASTRSLPEARTGKECCQVIQDKTTLSNIYFPDDQAYTERVDSYWSLTSQLSPECFVLPETSEEVASVIKTIVEDTQCKFAVRSGGHSSTEGANNIEDGVTIDLSMLFGTEYDSDTGLASVLPGTNWLHVYNKLDPLGRGVAGGRLGDVGVGGLLLGGGFSFYLYQKGLACDGIRGMEVVLSNGTIVEANEEQNADLFVALKGGGSNFGIVTRFDLETFNTESVWTMDNEHPELAGSYFFGPLKRWTDKLEDYPDGSATVKWTYRPKMNQTVIVSGLADVSGREMAPAFSELAGIRGYISSTSSNTNMSTIAQRELASGYRNIWWSLTLKNDQPSIYKATELHHNLVEEMKAESSDGDFETQCFFQPLPSFVGQFGPNIVGIDRQSNNSVVLLASLAVNGVDQEKLGRQKMMKWKQDLEEYAQERDSLHEYIYMNYADGSQDVVSSYGKENVCKMIAASEKYDPDGVMQSRQPGGFKLPADVEC